MNMIATIALFLMVLSVVAATNIKLCDYKSADCSGSSQCATATSGKCFGSGTTYFILSVNTSNVVHYTEYSDSNCQNLVVSFFEPCETCYSSVAGSSIYHCNGVANLLPATGLIVISAIAALIFADFY